MSAAHWRRATPEDAAFLRHLFASTNDALQSLPPELRDALAEMQYRSRALSHAAQYPQAEDWILALADGTPAGRHLMVRRAQDFRSIDLAVLPAHQGCGLGTLALRDLQQRAAQARLGVSLRVARGNPAQRLYERMGFAEMGGDAIALEMLWECPRSELQR